MTTRTRLAPRIGASLISGLLLLAVAGSSVLAQSPSAPVAPDVTPVMSPTPAPSADPADGAFPATPSGDIVDPHATGWERIEVAPDGKTLTVYFLNGPSACNGLSKVDVSTADGVTTVTPYIGLTPEAMFTTCVTGLFLYKTTVTLDAPLMGGGVAG